MAVGSNRVVKGFDVFEYQTVRLPKVVNPEAIQPFPFNQGVERLNAGVIPWISLLGIASLHLFRRLPVFGSHILAAAVRMNQQRPVNLATRLCLDDCIDDAGHDQPLRERPDAICR